MNGDARPGRRPARVLLVALVGLLIVPAQALAAPVTTADQSRSVRFSAAADYGATRATAATLDTAAALGGVAHLALGDLKYGDLPTEAKWCDFVRSRLGSLPVGLLTGNHESDGRDGRIDAFARCLPNRLSGVTGAYGKQWYVDIPAANPLVRLVMISPGLEVDGNRWAYRKGDARYRWTRRAIRSARAQGIDWVVVGMHTPCLSMGRYGCTSGAAIMNLLVRTRVDLVLTGHEHLYQRTKQLRTGPGCRSVRVRRYDRDCVASGSSVLRARRGTVFVTVGTGGTNLRDVRRRDRQRRYFAAWSGRNATPTHGLVLVDANDRQLTARFVPSTTRASTPFRDQVTIRR